MDVTARVKITEDGYEGADEFVHAEPGDVGEVIERVEHDHLMVFWPRNGSVVECHPDELAAAAQEADEEAA
jgi:hypothetical protein